MGGKQETIKEHLCGVYGALGCFSKEKLENRRQAE